MVLKEQVSLGPGGCVGTIGGTWLGDEQGGQRRTLQCAWTKQGGLQKQGSLTCQGVGGVSEARLGATPPPTAYRFGHGLRLRALCLLLVMEQA